MMTTTDKEQLSPKDDERMLLEKAAKAAGYEIDWSIDVHELTLPKVKGCYWNPLTDDGDALRLAVKLKMDVILDFDRVVVCFGASDEFVTEYFYVLPEPTDTYAATRRAIVRAAAMIGESM